MACGLTFDSRVVLGWLPHQQCCRLPIQGVCGVGVQQQLRQEHLKHVDQVCRKQQQHSRTRSAHGACCLSMSAVLTLRMGPVMQCKALLVCSTPDITQLPASDTGSFLQRRSSPNMGLHVWLMTSRHTEPDLQATHNSTSSAAAGRVLALPNRSWHSQLLACSASANAASVACNCCLHSPLIHLRTSTTAAQAQRKRQLGGSWRKAGPVGCNRSSANQLLAVGDPYPHAGDSRTALLHVPILKPETHVWVVYLVDKAYGGRLVGVGLWQLDMQLPNPAIVRACTARCMLQHESQAV